MARATSLRSGFPQRMAISSPIKKGVPKGKTARSVWDFPANKTVSLQVASGRGPSVPSEIEGYLMEELPQARIPPSGTSPSSNQVPLRPCPWSPLPLACHFFGIPEFWLVSDSPTKGKGRGLSMGLPVVGPRTSPLPPPPPHTPPTPPALCPWPKRWMLVPGRSDGFPLKSAGSATVPLD